MLLCKPSDESGETQKLPRPFQGPYCLVELVQNTVKISRVDRPEEEPILVSIIDCTGAPK